MADRGEEETLRPVRGLRLLHGGLEFLLLQNQIRDVHFGLQDINHLPVPVENRLRGHVEAAVIVFGLDMVHAAVPQRLPHRAPRRRLRVPADHIVALPADELLRRQLRQILDARIRSHNRAVEIQNHDRDGDVVDDLPLQRHAVGDPLELLEALAREQKKVDDAADGMDVAVRKIFPAPDEIEPDKAPQLIVDPDSADQQRADLLPLQEGRLGFKSGRRMIQVGDDDLLPVLQQPRPSPRVGHIAVLQIGDLRFDSVADPLVDVVGIFIRTVRIPEHVTAVGAALFPDDVEHALHRRVKIVLQRDLRQRAVDDPFAVDVIVQRIDRARLLLLELILARNVDPHADQQPGSVGADDRILDGADDEFAPPGIAEDLLAVELFSGGDQPRIVLPEFLRRRTVHRKDLMIETARNLLRIDAEHSGEDAVSQNIAEIVVRVLDEDISGQVVHDRLKQFQVVAVAHLVLPRMGDVLNHAAEFAAAVERIDGLLRQHFKITASFTRSGGVNQLQLR